MPTLSSAYERILSGATWLPQGLQEGFGQPVALLKPKELHAAANDAARYFTDVDAFKEDLKREVL